MADKTLGERIMDIEFDVAVMLGLLEGIVTKAARWDEHVDKKERLLNRLENARRNKRRKAERVKQKKEAKIIQAEVDRENLADEMEKEKEIAIAKLDKRY